jgi:septum formation protein
MLVLASKSPRRREILASAGIPFRVHAVDVPEVRIPGEHPETYVIRLARAKAEAVPIAPGDTVLGADTVVVVGHHMLEKPVDASDAARMLRLLSGREHYVVTGVCLRSPETQLVETATTAVHFLNLTGAEIDAYVASGEPMDKAGAYAIQGRASIFIHRIEGCYFNVVGLPIALVYRLIKTLAAAGPEHPLRSNAPRLTP